MKIKSALASVLLGLLVFVGFIEHIPTIFFSNPLATFCKILGHCAIDIGIGEGYPGGSIYHLQQIYTPGDMLPVAPSAWLVLSGRGSGSLGVALETDGVGSTAAGFLPSGKAAGSISPISWLGVLLAMFQTAFDVLRPLHWIHEQDVE